MPRTIFLSAGEASGDHYGAQVVEELWARLPGASFFGLGGLEMERAGQERVVRAEDVAVMGITEVIRHMPHIYREYRRLVAAIKVRKPDVAVLIDFPDVNFRLAKHCKRLGIPVVWFVSPQLWAWKRRRLRWVQERVSRMMVIFPFEESFYKARGVEVEFVGHPLAEMPRPGISREEYAKKAGTIHQEQWNYATGVMQSTPIPGWAFYKSMEGIRYSIDPQRQWIALLPGSRGSEIHANLSELVAAAILLGHGYEYLIPVAPTVGQELLQDMQEITGELLIGPNPPRVTFVHDARAAMFHARASIVASGTATVQAAVIGNPFVVVYRVSALTFSLAKRLVTYPAEIPAQVDEAGNLPIAMVNLVAGRRVVPELLQENFTGANVAAALRPLLAEGAERETMIRELAAVRERLMPLAGSNPIQRVCDAVQGLLSGSEPPSGQSTAPSV